MATLEDRNYWMDPRVRVRAAHWSSYRLDEKRMVAIVPRPRHEDCDDCADMDEGPCEAHSAPWSEEQEIQHLDAEAEARRPLARPSELEVPFRWTICGTCDGRGSHVNPSIDCGGISREDFDDDPDFAESYFAGDYDVTCSECRGRRVVPSLAPSTDEQRAAAYADEKRAAEEARWDAEERRERAMGY